MNLAHLGSILILISCSYNNSTDGQRLIEKTVERKLEIINAESVDTLVYADSWETSNFTKEETRDFLRTTKTIDFLNFRIEIGQVFVKTKDHFKDRTLKLNGEEVDLTKLYNETYETDFDNQYHFMANLVTAKRQKEFTTIDLLLVENNCIGEFCNDVVILTLYLYPDGKHSCTFHDENLVEYDL